MLIQNLFWNYWLKIVINCCVTIHLVLTEKFSQKMILHNVLNIFLGPFKIVITDKFYSLNSSWCNVPACAQNKIPSDSICWPPAENRRHARRLQKLNYWPSNKKRSRCEFGHSFVHSLDSSTQKLCLRPAKFLHSARQLRNSHAKAENISDTTAPRNRCPHTREQCAENWRTTKLAERQQLYGDNETILSSNEVSI